RDPRKYDVVGAWISSDWAGAIKPSVDLKKEVAGYKEMISAGLITRARATRELTGMKFSKVTQQLKSENEALAKATEPLLALAAKFNISPEKVLPTAEGGLTLEAIEDKITELLEDGGTGNA
ncbi:unnamed protein product, partial [marine sediment metagenome]